MEMSCLDKLGKMSDRRPNEKELLKNKELIKDFPFIQIDDFEDVTWLDFMPAGWKKAFGRKMCEEIKECLVKENCLDTYVVVNVKEKWGKLDWFSFSETPATDEIEEKYHELSGQTCCGCGKLATMISLGWVCPWCDDCAKDIKGKFKRIKEG